MTTTSAAKIAIFLPSLRGGGAERAMLNLAQGIGASGHPVDLVLARAEGPYLSDVAPPVRLIDLNARRVLHSLPGLVRYLRRERPQALLSSLDYANVVAVWARTLARAPLCHAVNEQNTLSVDGANASSLIGQLMPRLVAHTYPRADLVIGNSQGVVDDLRRLLGDRCAVQLLHNPVITPALAERADAELDHPWFAPGEPPVVLAVGRLATQKDYPTLLRAFARVRRARAARLMILGQGPKRDELTALIDELRLGDDVALPGFVANPYAYMRRTAAYVLSSRWEGLPTVLIEALYCGAAVVATDCPSGAREILADGHFGRLVPVGDAQALADAIAETLDAPPAAAPAASWQPYTAPVVAERYLRALLPSGTAAP